MSSSKSSFVEAKEKPDGKTLEAIGKMKGTHSKLWGTGLLEEWKRYNP